jgi:hypothetical protein
MLFNMLSNKKYLKKHPFNIEKNCLILENVENIHSILTAFSIMLKKNISMRVKELFLF